MPTALILEIEEFLFDTRSVRAAALCDALEQEGASIDRERVAVAHRGVPAAMALQRLAPLLDLDPTGHDLVLRRAADAASRIFSVHLPAFDADSRDALETIHSDCAIGVVTRATSAEALQWLEAAGLDASVATVRSMAPLAPAEYAACWADALRRSHATRGVAVAAPALLRIARQAGLRTLQIGPDPDPSLDGYHPDAQLESLSQLHAAFLAIL
jgi:hypothetical protein